MPIQIATETVQRTKISLDGDIDPDQRVKIVFNDGDELLFVIEKDSFNRVCLVLDQALTRDDIVTGIMMPDTNAHSLCGHDECAEDGHMGCKPFDPLSVIDFEQYKALRRVYLELDKWSRDEDPQIGETLMLWEGWRHTGGGSGGVFKPDNVIAAIELVNVGSDS